MAAGYCWPWSDPNRDGTLVPDVAIDGWSRPWNLKGDRAVGDAPPAPLWAHDPRGFGQVGCVYTAQGFEYDWSGVVIGPDLVWREGRMVSRRDRSKDPDVRNRTRVSDADFDRLVRNIYKVLLTRGMVGTVLYTRPTPRPATPCMPSWQCRQVLGPANASRFRDSRRHQRARPTRGPDQSRNLVRSKLQSRTTVFGDVFGMIHKLLAANAPPTAEGQGCVKVE